MHLYGDKGYILIDDATTIRYRFTEKMAETLLNVPQTDQIYLEPFKYFVKAIKGDLEVGSNDLSSLQNNMIVVEILEAARQSSLSGQKVYLNK